MRIGFEAKRLFHNFTGLGNYSRTLVSNLARLYPEHEYLLFTPSVRTAPRTAEFLTHARMRVVEPHAPNPLWRLWTSKNNAMQEKVDLFHGLSHEIPFHFEATKIPSVVTIHDLIFKEYPEQYGWADRHIYSLKFGHACRNATKIVAISENTKRDIIKYFGISEDKVAMIPQTCDRSFYSAVSRKQKHDVRNKYNLPSEYLLYVGSLIERKRLLSIVQALATFPKNHRPALVVIGRGREYKRRVVEFIQKSGLTDDVHFVPHVAFSDFPAVYQSATAMVYPSIAEGFGIPIIEALFSKIPVITSNRSCLPEAAGPSSLLVDPDNTEDFAQAIARVVSDSTLRSHMISEGHAYVQRFHESVVTHQMMELYKSLAE
jgi:glycosyltransferase involved in cell wall biosynthesis